MVRSNIYLPELTKDSSCRIYYVESGAIVSALSDLEPKCPVFACVYLCSPIANIDRTGTYQILSSVLEDLNERADINEPRRPSLETNGGVQPPWCWVLGASC
ncbi:hypothetical protein LZ32DRAFT_641827 [Colletotrichum eremochloae]|nr:hypothetical protein LZ32DRAFT_641827 [Colletotrichum eremochloae]